MADIYTQKTSLDVILKVIKAGQDEIPHGAKNKLAKIIQCHPTYVAQILRGIVLMSQEQALLFCKEFDFNDQQTDFFLILLNIERAGTLALKNYYETKKNQLESKLGEVGRSLKASQLDEQFEEEFFSNWDFQSIYAALTLYGLKRSFKKITESLGIATDRANYILAKLQEFKMVTEINGKWTVNNTKIHFNGKNPEARQKFHLAWRLKALEKNFVSSAKDKDNFNFSSIITLNKTYHEKLIMMLKKLIQDFSQDIDAIETDSISVLNIDFFQIHKN